MHHHHDFATGAGDVDQLTRLPRQLIAALETRAPDQHARLSPSVRAHFGNRPFRLDGPILLSDGAPSRDLQAQVSRLRAEREQPPLPRPAPLHRPIVDTDDGPSFIEALCLGMAISMAIWVGLGILAAAVL